MLSLGLTGGIASGKSLLSARFRELGAVVIDADQLARDVLAPDTEGLAAVVRHFGESLLTEGGTLDRAALGAVVFADKGQLAVLNSIVHPRVRAAAQSLKDGAGPDAIVVQDIPLLAETGQGSDFHLVLVVTAPADLRVQRMVNDRGMTEAEARARMAAQASDSQREAVADILLDNSGDPALVIAAVDALWHERLVPFARNLAAGVPAQFSGPPVIVNPDPTWPAQAARLTARLANAVGELAVGIDHIGSTAVPGLAAKDVIDLQIRVRALADADAMAASLSTAGFPRQAGEYWDTGHDFAGGRAGERWEKRFHNAADPGRAVNLHLRVDGSPAARFAVAFRDWLRAEPQARQRYEDHKRSLAAEHAEDDNTAGYAVAKEPWFAQAVPELTAWLAG